jgi:hypothetical protein
MEAKRGELVSPLEPHNHILDFFYSEIMGTDRNKNLLVEER